MLVVMDVFVLLLGSLRLRLRLQLLLWPLLELRLLVPLVFAPRHCREAGWRGRARRTHDAAFAAAAAAVGEEEICDFASLITRGRSNAGCGTVG